MKLNKFLVAAAAVAVLPLSVANANDEAPKSEKGPALVNEVPEFNGGVNGPVATNDVKPYAEKGAALVNEKPEYKVSSTTKNTAPAKTDKVQKALPKTSAVK